MDLVTQVYITEINLLYVLAPFWNMYIFACVEVQLAVKDLRPFFHHNRFVAQGNKKNLLDVMYLLINL